MAYHFRNLVFEGAASRHRLRRRDGGARKEGHSSEHPAVGGTSAGAINALLLGLNYTPAETKQILSDLDFRNFLDDTWGWYATPTASSPSSAGTRGTSSGAGSAIGSQPRREPDATFNDIHNQMGQKGFRELFFVGTNLSTGFAEVFSNEHTPRWCVRMPFASRCPSLVLRRQAEHAGRRLRGRRPDRQLPDQDVRSREVRGQQGARPHPEYYRTHNGALEAQGKSVNPYVYNVETLGFRLDSAKEIAVFRDQAEPEHQKIEDFFSYLSAWSEPSWRRRAASTCTATTGSARSISTHWEWDDGLRPVRRAKVALAGSGTMHTEEYFAWYDDPKNTPANRPTQESRQAPRRTVARRTARRTTGRR